MTDAINQSMNSATGISEINKLLAFNGIGYCDQYFPEGKMLNVTLVAHTCPGGRSTICGMQLLYSDGNIGATVASVATSSSNTTNYATYSFASLSDEEMRTVIGFRFNYNNYYAYSDANGYVLTYYEQAWE